MKIRDFLNCFWLLTCSAPIADNGLHLYMMLMNRGMNELKRKMNEKLIIKNFVKLMATTKNKLPITANPELEVDTR